MSRSVKKGPFVEAKLYKRVCEGRKESFEDLVSRLYHLPGFRRSHHCRIRRQKARPGICS